MTFSLMTEAGNRWGEQFIHFAWSLLWQSSLLITAMFLLDLVVRRKIRASVRYAFWLVVIMKLLLPPSLAFPTGVGWWLRQRERASMKPQVSAYVVTYGASRALPPVNAVYKAPSTPEAKLSVAAGALIATVGIALALLGLMLVRWRWLQRELRPSRPTPTWVAELLANAQGEIRYRRPVRIVITNAFISPALWGLFRPVIVLPVTLIDRLSPSQLRTVLLHELFHLRNGDVWLNCFQSLLQIVYWWHPLLWFANARIRSVREEAVDDAVRVALGEEAESYPPTLLEVARLALARPAATLGLIGILESRHALRQRVQRLTSSPVPRKAGLTMLSVFVVFAFASVALPMGQAPAKAVSSINDSNPRLGELQKEKVTDQPLPALSIQPKTDAGWIDFDSRSGVATATNGAVLTYGDMSVSADKISLNHETGEVVAEGAVYLKALGTDLPMGGKLSMNLTNVLQLAQLQTPGSYPSASGQGAINGRKAIVNKLNAIHLDNVVFDNLPLSEVVNYLSNESKKRDPEGKGINFILMPFVSATASGTINPATGGANFQAQDNADELNNVSIRLPVPLNDVRMADVLDAITKVADKRIRYSIEDYAVSFRLAGNEPSASPLFTRRIQVDPGMFAQGLESVVGFSVGNFQTGGQGGGGQQGASGITVPRVQVAPNAGAGQGGQGGGIQGGGGGISGVTRPTAMISPQAIRQFFMNAGVDLTPPKSVLYNDRAGSLMVHATLEDLDKIEQAVGGLAAFSTQPKIAVQNESVSKAVSPQANQTKAPVSTAPPPQVNIKVKFVEIPKGDTLSFLSVLKDLRLQNPGGGIAGIATSTSAELDGSFAEVLTDGQFRDLLKAVEQRDGADLLTEASVTTLSGRQAQIQIVDITTILVKLNPQALVPPGVSATNLFVTEKLPVGPVLDVNPLVGDDGMTVALDVTATVTGFMGYDTPEKGKEEQVYVDGKVKSMRPPFPHLRVRQIQYQLASVSDGQTLMLANPKDTMIKIDKDGKEIHEPGVEKKDLLVFLTTTLIDSAGNPIHDSVVPGQK